VSIHTHAAMSAHPHVAWGGAVAINAVSSMIADAILLLTQLLYYTGAITAGSVVVIDCDEMTVTLNGANDVKHMAGEFMRLSVGTNELRWYDTEGARTVGLHERHSPRTL